MTTASADQAPQALHHTVRNSLADRERRYSLEPDRLSWIEKTAAGSLSYADIKSVQLISYGGSGGTQYQSRLMRRNGGVVKIRSHHYIGLGNFEDRGQTYAPFMRELCHRIDVAAPDARFLSGSTALWMLWWVIGLLAALVLILAVSIAYLPSAPALPAFIVLVAAVPLIWREARKGPTTTFDPNNPPQNLLGME